jgi:hypothetical protein
MDSMTGWVPFGIRWRDAEALVDWCPVGETRFTDPFFDQTIDRCRREIRQPDRVIPLDAFGDEPGVRPPAAFLFHTSRCGSTWLAQMLASVPRFTVLSEPAVLSSLLRPPAGFFAGDSDRQVRWLRNLIGLLGRSHGGLGEVCFIKFASRDIDRISLIRRAFPEVPWVFLYREPGAVLASLVGDRGEVLPPGLIDSGLLGGNVPQSLEMRPAEFWARVLARCFRAALDAHDPARSRLVNYTQLPDVLWTSLLSGFGIVCTGDEVEALRTASRFDSKAPGRLFGRKPASATEEIRALVDSCLREDYERLEAIRLGAEEAS